MQIKQRVRPVNPVQMYLLQGQGGSYGGRGGPSNRSCRMLIRGSRFLLQILSLDISGSRHLPLHLTDTAHWPIFLHFTPH